MHQEQCWLLPSNAGAYSQTYEEDMVSYFSIRSGQGITAWFGTAWGEQVNDSPMTYGRTWDGTYPFLMNGTAGPCDGTSTLTLNGTFWTRIDYLFATALTYGISCFLNLGMSYDFDSYGSDEVWSGVSSAQLTAFGTALAERYPQSSYPHVFWFFGDDSSGGEDDAYFGDILAGLTAGGDSRNLISMEQYGETNCHIRFEDGAVYVSGGFGMTKATYNWCYTYCQCYSAVEDSYAESGTTLIPVVWGDGPYYGDTDNSTPDYTLRRFCWWALASGARGFNSTSGPSNPEAVVFGWKSGAVAALTSDPIGPFFSDVSGPLTSYFTSLTDWWKLIPDTGNVFITAGRGTREGNPAPTLGSPAYGDSDDYVAGSITPAGTLAVIYCAAALLHHHQPGEDDLRVHRHLGGPELPRHGERHAGQHVLLRREGKQLRREPRLGARAGGTVMAYTVTATQSANPSPYGMTLQVLVLDYAVMATPTPAAGTANTEYYCSVTTTTAGSYVFGIAECGNGTPLTPESICSTYSSFPDTTNGTWYGVFQTTAATGTPGATTVGYSSGFDASGGVGAVAVEVLASGGSLAIDSGSPAIADSPSASAVTTASFTPGGSATLLAAIVATNGVSGATAPTIAMSETGGTLTWTESARGLLPSSPAIPSLSACGRRRWRAAARTPARPTRRSMTSSAAGRAPGSTRATPTGPAGRRGRGRHGRHRDGGHHGYRLAAHLPGSIPLASNYMVDQVPRVVVSNYDNRPVFEAIADGPEPGTVLTEWDIAFSCEMREAFTGAHLRPSLKSCTSPRTSCTRQPPATRRRAGCRAPGRKCAAATSTRRRSGRPRWGKSGWTVRR